MSHAPVHDALAYATRGWPVFPCWPASDGRCACPTGSACKSPGKHPLTEHGFKDATTDEVTIRRWWERWPDANVAIATGATSGLLVIDVDPRHGGDVSLDHLQTELGPLPDTLRVTTQSKGTHYYLRCPGADIRSVAGQLAAGIDIRAEGGYVIAPPSTGAVGRYAWDTAADEPDDPIAEISERWRKRLADDPRGPASPVTEVIQEGHRNATLTSLAGTMRQRGMGEESILAALAVVNRTQCRPPLPDGEVGTIARSVARYPPGQPAGPAAPPADGTADAVALASFRIHPVEWTKTGHVKLRVRREGQLVRVDRIDPASSRSRATLIKALEQLDPSLDRDLAHQELSRLCDRAPPLPDRATESTQGAAVSIETIEPWPEPVDGTALAAELEATFRRYMVMAPSAIVVIVLWLLAAHVYDRFDLFPRLNVRSPTKRCGKTRLLDLIGALLARALTAASLSSAVLFRIVEEHHPVLLLDEVDRYLGESPEIIGLLNAGHKRGGQAYRCVGEDHTPRGFDVYCPVVMAGIGDPPDTLMDRSFEIALQRRVGGERVARLRARDLASLQSDLVSRIVRWTNDHAAELEESDPAVPEDLDDRAADNAVPLLAVADQLGDEWSLRARLAIQELCTGRQDGDDSAALQILADVRDLFEELGEESLPTRLVVQRLNGREDRPWSEHGKGGQPMKPWHLGKLLGEFGVKSHVLAGGGRTAGKARGYRRSDLETSWSRYLPALPLRDSVALAPPTSKTSENGQTPLRSQAPSEHSDESRSSAVDGAETPKATESQSGPRVDASGTESERPRAAQEGGS